MDALVSMTHSLSVSVIKIPRYFQKFSWPNNLHTYMFKFGEQIFPSKYIRKLKNHGYSFNFKTADRLEMGFVFNNSPKRAQNTSISGCVSLAYVRMLSMHHHY